MSDRLHLNEVRLQALQSALNHILSGRVPDLATAAGRADFARLVEQLAQTPRAGETNRSGLPQLAMHSPYTAVIADNSAVLPALVGQEKATLIYLDPPYNTGKDMMYADTFGTRKSWTDLMLHTLTYARQLLEDTGVVCVSLDENEIMALRLLADGVFGADNFVAEFVWETKRAARGVPPRNLLMTNHEYVVCYAKNKNYVTLNGLPRDTSDFRNPDNDPRGPWRSESMKATGRGGSEYTICDPGSGRTYTSLWAFAQVTMEQKIQDGLVLFPPTPHGTPRQKKHLTAYRNTNKACTTSLGWYSTEQATRDLMDIFDGVKVFPFPKPLGLMNYLIEQFTKPGDLIIDPFAGSGSTGHAVMEINARECNASEPDARDSLLSPPLRRCLLIQRPEPCPRQWPAAQAGFTTIADIMMYRLTQVADRLNQPAWVTIPDTFGDDL